MIAQARIRPQRTTKPSELNLSEYTDDARRLVLTQFSRTLEYRNIDPEDVIQDVYVRLLNAQQTEGSRYDPARGLSQSTYIYRVGACAALNSLRNRKAKNQELHHYHEVKVARDDDGNTTLTSSDEYADPNTQEESYQTAFARIAKLLNTDQERATAKLLAEGNTLVEIALQLGVSKEEADTLRATVRLILAEAGAAYGL